MPAAEAAPFPLAGDYGVANWLRAHARELGAIALPALHVVATEGSTALRGAAAFALLEIAPEAAEAFVIDRALNDPEPEVREAATRALGLATGEAALSYLRTAEQERAAAIALRQRFGRSTTAELEAFVATVLATDAREDRCASVALEILGERVATPELVLTIVRHRPGLLAHGGAEGLGAVLRDARQDEILAAVASGRAPAGFARHLDATRVFDHLAAVVSAGPSALAEAIVAVLAEQASAAWSSVDERGFDDGDPPLLPVPDARWRPVLATYVAPDDHDHTQEIASLRGALEWTYVPRALHTPSFRFIEAGAEDGAPFVLAGFDVSELRDTTALAVALATLGDRATTNLHHVSHQCGGYGCCQYTLLGIPLGSPALTEQLSPMSTRVRVLEEILGTWTAPNAGLLEDARRELLPFVPHLPELVSGLEALVWTAPGSLVESLCGIPVVTMCPLCHPWRSTSGSWYPPADALRDRGAFDATHQTLLEEVGRRLGLGAPRIFVLWANSD